MQGAGQKPLALPLGGPRSVTHGLAFCLSLHPLPSCRSPLLTGPRLHLRFPLCCAACRKEHNLTGSSAWMVQKSPNHSKHPPASPPDTVHPSLLAVLRFQTMMMPEEGPPMVEGNLPLPLETLTKSADNRKQSLLKPRSLCRVNLTHLPCHAPGQAAEETTGGVRESIQIPEGCAELCWLFQAHDSYLPAVLPSGEQSRHQHLCPSHFFLCCRRTSSYRASTGSHSHSSPFVTLKRCAASKEEQHKKKAFVLACSCAVPATSQASSRTVVLLPASAAAAACPTITDSPSGSVSCALGGFSGKEEAGL